MAQVRLYLAKGGQHETAPCHAGMGKDEIGGIDDLVAAQEEIQVEGAGTPGRGALSEKEIFDGEQSLQQLASRSRGSDADAGVEEQGLFGKPDRFGLEERGDGQQIDPGPGCQLDDGGLQEGSPIAQVRAQAHIGGVSHTGA